MRRFHKNAKKRMLAGAVFFTFALGLTGCDSLKDINLEKTEENSLEEMKEDEKYQLIEKYIDKYYLYEVDEDKEKEEMYRALVAGLDDPYSYYYTKEEYKELMESYQGTFCGIGVSVGIKVNEDVPYAIKVFKNSGAQEAGMQDGDRIVAVDGTDVAGMELDEVVGMTRGEEGTTLDVTVYRESSDEYIDFTITRKEVVLETVEHRMLDSDIGYVGVYSFDENTDEQFAEAIDDLESQGMQSMIIDLRNNGGGMLVTMVNMLDYILPKERLIYCLDKEGNNIGTEYSTNKHQVEMPIVILVNEYSASASECFAGTMQDYDAATVVGTQSYGKGVMQQIYELPDGSGLKLTVAEYYTGGGRNIHGVGITPDVVIELPDEVLSEEDDTQLAKAKEILLEQMR